MNQDEIYEKVRQIVLDNTKADKEKITLESNFADDLGADSLTLVELVMQFEEKFELDISDEDANQIKTVGQVVEYIEGRLKQK